MKKFHDWIGRNRKALAYTAAAVAVPFGTHFLFDAKLFDGESIYQMTNSSARFLNYVYTAGMLGRAIQITQEGKKGAPLTVREKMKAYGVGALAASALSEGWENIGSAGPVYEALRGAFGDFAKQDFPGKGLASLGDAAVTMSAAEAGVALKEYLSKLREKHKERKFRESYRHN